MTPRSGERQWQLESFDAGRVICWTAIAHKNIWVLCTGEEIERVGGEYCSVSALVRDVFL